MVFADALVEAIVTDATVAGPPASAYAATLVQTDPTVAALDRHDFARRLGEALVRPESVDEGWEAADDPLPFRMRVLSRVLGCIYADTDIHGRPLSAPTRT